MILEAAILHIEPGSEKEYEEAFRQASPLITSQKGYISHQLQRCLEEEGKYLLLVEWETVEDHTNGFRQSEEYQQWKALLHPFYEPFPVVEHFERVL
ncbi:antibiotic biosynthesis monooxygenase [Radiobacillus kanasensis]|uniref:antibiotic biosynthesis monooxygenase family protein n=1 Tax=Radiobacillus kanasensis TaxID=2844358 RepID=UPI001E2A46F7|nr:antibiotic biosynthesis monooxygenase [Radiobacillus kanasensis]UFT99244.1 antibiotic biosynthesis monooxygenase [Radiobacillus kanasensis]